MSSVIKIGWSEISITPDKKASLMGQFAERISQYVEKPITATAMAIDGDDQAVFVSVDINGISYNLVDAIRENLKNNTVGLDPLKVVFAATHSHTAPGYPRYNQTAKCGMYLTFKELLERELPEGKKYVAKAQVTDNPDVITGDEMFELLTERLSKVALQAWEKRKPSAYVNAFGRAAVGLNRRAVYTDGTSKMWGDTNSSVFEEVEGASDSGIELLFVKEKDDNEKIKGIVVNLACPAQCVQHRLFLSPDFWGEVKVLLRQRFGEDLFVLPLCSMCGDQCPVDLIRWVAPESELNDPNIIRNNPPKRKADPSMFDLSGMRKIGKRIAREVIDVYEEGLDEFIDGAPIIHDVTIMQLPLRKATITDVNSAKKEIRDYINNKDGDVDYNDTANLTGPLGDLLRFAVQERMDVVDSEVHVIRLGNIAFATNPFEPFINYGNQIKARSKAEQTFLVQLANGAEGYIPTKKAENGGHYSGFIASGTVGHIGGELLVGQTLKTINKLFE